METTKVKKKKPAKKKKSKKKVKVKKQKITDPNVLEIVEKEIEINCPVRGKIKKMFKVKVLKPVKVDHRQLIESSDYVDKINDDDSPIYGVTESEEESESNG